MIEEATSRRAALESITKAMAAAGIDDARQEARLLVMAALELDLTRLILEESQPLGPQAARLAALLARRLNREPLSRILGQREFFGLDFTLGPETLDPRADTEVLVEVALRALKGKAEPRLLDLGTGTGAILLALLHTLPEASGIGVDLSPEAAAIAAHNAARLGLGDRAGFLTGDLFAPLAAPLARKARFDAILSNPPYIPSADLATLDPEVRLFDPARALDGGTDGLTFYRAIAAAAADYLKPGALLAVEVGQGQADDVAQLFVQHGFAGVTTTKDLSGIARVVEGYRAPV